MSQTTILLLVASLCGIMLLAVLLLFPLLRRNGVKTEQLLQVLRTGAGEAASLSHSVRSLAPDSQIIGTLDQILQCAQIGVAKAEQLYKIGEVEGAQRKQAALDFVYDSLSLAGIQTTDTVRSVVDGCVEASVHGLGHTGRVMK